LSDLHLWETRFGSAGYLFGTEPNAFLRGEAGRLRRGQQALAIADGEGRNGVWLAEQGLDVVSVDFSPTALAKAAALAASRGVSLRTVEADLATWVWPTAAFDVIVAIFIQFASPDIRHGIFAGMKQALRPGGLLLMEGYRPKQLEYRTGGPPHIENLYTRTLLETAFADFAALEIREHDSVLVEGTAHAGLSALIDLIGVK
jgi:cyclopropane fatty-acyl-phospholipid synthase-like methyltransferase